MFQEINHHTTPFVLPEPGPDGKVHANKETGGRRRIDKILYRPEHLFGNPSFYYFTTALASLTDHVPVIMQFKATDVIKKDDIYCRNLAPKDCSSIYVKVNKRQNINTRGKNKK